MSLLNSMYSRLPESIQNLAITAYGANQSHKRFGGDFADSYSEILESCSLQKDDLKKHQNEKLKALITYGYQHVPYFSDVLKKHKASPNDINLSNFSDIFPVLEKTQIAERPDYYSSADKSVSRSTLFTSGTTGTPLTIQYEESARRVNYAHYCWLLSLLGVHYRDRSVTFAGRNLFADHENKSFWRKDYWNRTLYCSSYYLSEEKIQFYLDAIEQWNPAFIDSYPSAIYLLAEFILRHGLQHNINLKLIFTSSETLLDYQYDAIKEAFNCPIIDQYGCTEMAVMAYRIDREAYKVAPLYGLVEPYNEDPDTNTTEILCTGLFNRSMPLIRYRIGDSLLGYTAEPGFEFQRTEFSAVVGRLDDLVITPEGKKIGRLDPAFKGVSGIKEAQIIQERANTLVVRISPAENYSRETVEKLLAKNLRERTSPTMVVMFDYATPIEKSRTGKFKAVIRKV